jgi:hypothetical protein
MPLAFLGIQDPTIAAAVAGGLVAIATALITTWAAGPLRLRVDKKLQESQAKTDYELAQRKELRTKVGAYRGRLLEAATSLNYRLDNLRENQRKYVGEDCSEVWLCVNGEFSAPSTERYYFRSTIYRFMALVAVTNRFERAAIYVDPRYGEREDELLVFYVRALRWALTDPKLFAHIEPQYKQSEATAHFFTDDLRRMCATLTREDNELLDLHDVERLLAGDHDLGPVLAYFDGIQPRSLKWDRLMAFGLLLKGLINAIGYKTHQSGQSWFDVVAGDIADPQVARNLDSWLPTLGLDDDGAAYIRHAVAARLQSANPSTADLAGTSTDGTEPQV